MLEILNDQNLIHHTNLFIAWNPAPLRNRYDCYNVFDKEFSNPKMKFLIDHTILIKKLIHDKLYFKKFIDIVNTKKDIIYVGPTYMHNKNNPIKYTTFIEIPKKNCFECSHKIYKNIVNNINKDSIIFFSGGLGIKHIIYNLYKNFGSKVTLIDMGSVLDPFFDLWSRATFTKNKDEIKKTISFVLENNI